MNNKDKEMLVNGNALAAFSNLKDGEIGDFRQKNPGFVPEAWWHVQTTVEKESSGFTFVWKEHQRELQVAWQSNPKFPLEDTVRLVAAGPLPDAAFVGMGPSEKVHVAPNEVTIPHSETGKYGIGGPNLPIFRAQVWPYQRAVMSLAMDPWRARLCMYCSKRFFADMPKRLYCSSECSGASHTAAKRKWFRTHGSEWRADRNGKKPPTNRKRTAKKRS